jgi:hypothetical protein
MKKNATSGRSQKLKLLTYSSLGHEKRNVASGSNDTVDQSSLYSYSVLNLACKLCVSFRSRPTKVTARSRFSSEVRHRK